MRAMDVRRSAHCPAHQDHASPPSTGFPETMAHELKWRSQQEGNPDGFENP